MQVWLYTRQGKEVAKENITMKHVLIVFGVAGFLLAVAPIIIAVIPFVLAVIGVVFLWFGIAWIIKGCIDIYNHEIWRM